MHIIINNISMQPIYEQIVDQIKAGILDQSLPEDTPLPSVRGLARELKISALTVKKAYDFLEEEGYVVTVHGKGSYIAHANLASAMEERRRKVEQHLEEAINEGITSGMQPEEIQSAFDLLMEEYRQ